MAAGSATIPNCSRHRSEGLRSAPPSRSAAQAELSRRRSSAGSRRSHSIATALPLLALSFFLIVPMFLFVARETTRLRWLCVVLLVTAGRCTLWLRYRGAESRVVDFTQWSWGATCGSLL